MLGGDGRKRHPRKKVTGRSEGLGYEFYYILLAGSFGG